MTRPANFVLSRTAVIGAGAALALSGAAGAQTLARYAPADAVFALEVSDLAGARRQAASFVRQFEALKLTDALFSAGGVSAGDRRLLNDLGRLIEREGLISLHVSPTSLEPRVLLAARPAVGSEARVRALTEASLRDARAGGARVSTLREGRFTYYVTTPRQSGGPGGSPMSFGFQDGLAYASTDVATLRSFLRRVNGSGTANLAGVGGYRAAMSSVGPGTLRVYGDLKVAAALLRDASTAGVGFGGLKLAPLVNALATAGRFGAAWRVTRDGLETATALAPDPRAGDPALLALLTPRRGVTLKAADQVPATALSFSTGPADPAGLYSYLSGLVDRTGLNPGGLSPLLTSQFGFDPRKTLLPWMGSELATATFAPARGATASNSLGEGIGATTAANILGDSVFYLAVTNEAAARAGLRASLPRLIGTAGALAGAFAPGVAPRAAPASSQLTISGTAVTRYPLGSGFGLATAVKNGYLLLASSEGAMRAALAAGPRLTNSAAFQNARRRVPATASGYGFGDTARTLRTTGASLQGPLSLALSVGADLSPGQALRFAGGVKRLIDFAASRAGSSVSWTETVNGVTRTRTSRAVRW